MLWELLYKKPNATCHCCFLVQVEGLVKQTEYKLQYIYKRYMMLETANKKFANYLRYTNFYYSDELRTLLDENLLI